MGFCRVCLLIAGRWELLECLPGECRSTWLSWDQLMRCREWCKHVTVSTKSQCWWVVLQSILSVSVNRGTLNVTFLSHGFDVTMQNPFSVLWKPQKTQWNKNDSIYFKALRVCLKEQQANNDFSYRSSYEILPGKKVKKVNVTRKLATITILKQQPP